MSARLRRLLFALTLTVCAAGLLGFFYALLFAPHLVKNACKQSSPTCLAGLAAKGEAA